MKKHYYDLEGHFLMLKAASHLEDNTFRNSDKFIYLHLLKQPLL